VNRTIEILSKVEICCFTLYVHRHWKQRHVPCECDDGFEGDRCEYEMGTKPMDSSFREVEEPPENNDDVEDMESESRYQETKDRMKKLRGPAIAAIVLFSVTMAYVGVLLGRRIWKRKVEYRSHRMVAEATMDLSLHRDDDDEDEEKEII